MGKLINKDTLGVRVGGMKITPIAGWSWYCGYHDSYGIGDDRDEIVFMFGAHMKYNEVDGDVCEPYYREWKVKEEA